MDSSETTGIKLTGDQLLRLLLTGNDSKIFEAIFVGGDWFTGSNGNDVIYGYGDDDTIYGKGGNDLISGGPGRDTLLGDDGNDTITGGDGSDDISGGSGNDIIRGGGQWQWIDRIWGGSGDDTINAQFIRTFIWGEDGNDRAINLTTHGGLFVGGDGEDSATFPRDSKNYAISVSPRTEFYVVTSWGYGLGQNPNDVYVYDLVTVLNFYGGKARLFSTELLEFRDGTIPVDDFMYTGTYTPVASVSIDPIFRFYNTRDKAFFYTSSSDERDYVIQNSAPTYTSGTGGYQGETLLVHRYYSDKSHTSLFYYNRIASFDNDPNNYVYEGIFNLPRRADDDPEDSFALDDSVLIFIPDSLGADTSWPYVYQGATFEAGHTYLDSDKLAPVHRFYNYETGHHFFTISDAEADMIKEKSASGEWPFNYEGTRFSVYSSDPTPGYQGQEIAVARYYSPTLNRHFFTADQDEATQISLTGVWIFEGIAFWGETLG